MQNLFSLRFSENIWRVLPDSGPGSALWVIELRDAGTKSVSCALVDLAAEQLVWHRLIEGADWWTSLTAFSYGRIYLHNYRYPELPEPTDLLAVSAEHGDVLWILPNYVLTRAIGADMIEVATKTSDQVRRKLCIASTGEIAGDAESEALGPGESIILKEPVRYREGNVYFDRLSVFIEGITHGHKAIAIDYLESRPYIIFSYYIYDQDKTAQFLLIVNDQKQVILHEKLSEEREGLGRSTMMLKASTLVYLKNNNEFSSLTLS